MSLDWSMRQLQSKDMEFVIRDSKWVSLILSSHLTYNLKQCTENKY